MIAAQTEMVRITARAFTEKTPHASTIVAAAALKPALRTVKLMPTAAQEALEEVDGAMLRPGQELFSSRLLTGTQAYPKN